MGAFLVVMEMPPFLSEKPAYYPALNPKKKVNLKFKIREE